MKKYSFVLGLAVIMGLFILIVIIIPKHWYFPRSEKFEVINYHFPEDYQGCAIVIYNVPDAPTLEINDKMINYYFDDHGILLTSSPQDFGWEGKGHSGFHRANFYRGNQLLEAEDIVSHSTGEAELPLFGKIYYEQISVGYDACRSDSLDSVIRKLQERNS